MSAELGGTANGFFFREDGGTWRAAVSPQHGLCLGSLHLPSGRLISEKSDLLSHGLTRICMKSCLQFLGDFTLTL